MNLSQVVPADTTLQSIVGTVVPGASAGGGGAGAASLRADIAAPAFELTGCTANQDDVARLMSRLRLINGVTRVSFSDSQITGTAAAVELRLLAGLRRERAHVRPDRVLHARSRTPAHKASPRSAE